MAFIQPPLIDPSQFLQPTPYQQSPLARLLGIAGATLMAQRQKAEQEKQAAQQQQWFQMQVESHKRAQIEGEFNRLLALAGGNPYEAAKNPRFRELAGLLGIPIEMTGGGTQPLTIPQQRPEEGSLAMLAGLSSPGQQTLQIPVPQQFNIPGVAQPRQPAFRTAGEAAQRLGLKLRQGVDPNLDLSTLPPGFDPDSLFDKAGNEQAIAALRSFMQNYPMAQIRRDPRLARRFNELYEAAGRPQEILTEAIRPSVPQTFPAPPVTGTGPGLARAGLPQTMNVPGAEVTAPVLPEEPATAPKRVALLNKQTGKIQIVELPADTQVVDATPPGTTQTRHAIMDRNGRLIGYLPPGVVPNFLPAPPAGGRDLSMLSAGQQRIVNQYDELYRQEGTLITAIANAKAQGIPADDPSIADMQARVNDLRKRQERILNSNPWIAPFVGVPSPGAPPPVGQVPSERAAAFLAAYNQTKQPVPAEVWNVLTADERAWLEQRGVRAVGGAPAVREPVKPQRLPVVQMASRIRDAAKRRQPFPGSWLRQQGYSETEIRALEAVYNQSKPKK